MCLESNAIAQDPLEQIRFQGRDDGGNRMGSIASDKDVINIHEDEYSNTIQFYVNKDASTRDTQKP